MKITQHQLDNLYSEANKDLTIEKIKKLYNTEYFAVDKRLNIYLIDFWNMESYRIRQYPKNLVFEIELSKESLSTFGRNKKRNIISHNLELYHEADIKIGYYKPKNKYYIYYYPNY